MTAGNTRDGTGRTEGWHVKLHYTYSLALNPRDHIISCKCRWARAIRLNLYDERTSALTHVKSVSILASRIDDSCCSEQHAVDRLERYFF